MQTPYHSIRLTRLGDGAKRGKRQYYELFLNRYVNGFFTVDASYGAFQQQPRELTKTPNPLPYDQARALYDQEEARLRKMGYESANEPVQGGQVPRILASGAPPLEPEPIRDADELESLLADAGWAMQPQHAGVWLRVLRTSGLWQAVDRTGRVWRLPQATLESIEEAWGKRPGHVELHGVLEINRYRIFDAVRLGNEFGDLSAQPYEKRHAALQSIGWEGNASVVESVTSLEAKRALLDELRLFGTRGAVFRRLTAPHRVPAPGQPVDLRVRTLVPIAVVRVTKVLDASKVRVEARDAQGQAASLGVLHLPRGQGLHGSGACLEVAYQDVRDGALVGARPLRERLDVTAPHSIKELTERARALVPAAAAPAIVAVAGRVRIAGGASITPVIF